MSVDRGGASRQHLEQDVRLATQLHKDLKYVSVKAFAHALIHVRACAHALIFSDLFVCLFVLFARGVAV